MKSITRIFLLTVAIAHVYSAPQLISFKEGKIGVNFGGYHAAAGLGGLLDGGASGGLFAEAGTPFGQAARAGLGGSVSEHGGNSGGLYAGATAGGNVKAEAGLGGGVAAEKSVGGGFATAQAGDRVASSGLAGQSSFGGSTGFSFSKTKSYGGDFVKQVEVAPVEVHKVVEVHKEVQPVEVFREVRPVEVYTEVKPVEVHKEVKTVEVQKEVKPVEVHKEVEVKVEAANEVNPLPLAAKVGGEAHVSTNVGVQSETPASYVVKEVYVQQPPRVIEKEVHYRRIKPHRHHFHKTAYIGGYIGGDSGFAVPPPPPPPPAPVVYKTKFVQPVIEKRVDVGVESAASAGGYGQADVGGAGGANFGYTKQVTFQRNPTFFSDIFNIPISTLKAVGNFLGNTAGSTSVSVQKSASIQADKEGSSKLAPSSTSSSEAHISVQTPNASSFIDDILAIPINTLGAVNKFLENNVPARKRVQVSEDGDPAKVRFGRHARKRANKQTVVLEEASAQEPDAQTLVAASK